MRIGERDTVCGSIGCHGAAYNCEWMSTSYLMERGRERDREEDRERNGGERGEGGRGEGAGGEGERSRESH